jgi:hypothetical protein
VLLAPVRLEMRLEFTAQNIFGNSGALAHGMPSDMIGAERARLLDELRVECCHVCFS